MDRAKLITIFIFSLLAIIPAVAMMPPKPLPERVAKADKVFVGEVVAKIEQGDWIYGELLVKEALSNVIKDEKVEVIWRKSTQVMPMFDVPSGQTGIAILQHKHSASGRYFLRDDAFIDLKNIADVKALIAPAVNSKNGTKLYGSWAEAKANPGNIRILGYFEKQNQHKITFRSAIGDKRHVQILTQSFADIEGLKQLQQMDRYIIPAIASGSFSLRPIKSKPTGKRPLVTTGHYRGPFYDFEISKVEILSSSDALATSKSTLSQTSHSIYKQSIQPIAFKNLNVFVSEFEIKNSSSYVGGQKQNNWAVRVITKLVHKNKHLTYLDADANISDSSGDLKAIRTTNKYDREPVNKLSTKVFWFKVNRKPEGLLNLDMTFRAKGKGASKKESKSGTYTALAN